jgi:hypothetical protein
MDTTASGIYSASDGRKREMSAIKAHLASEEKGDTL